MMTEMPLRSAFGFATTVDEPAVDVKVEGLVTCRRRARNLLVGNLLSLSQLSLSAFDEPVLRNHMGQTGDGSFSTSASRERLSQPQIDIEREGREGVAPSTKGAIQLKAPRAPHGPLPSEEATEGTSWGYPVLVLGAVSSILEPFCGKLLSKK